MCLILMILLMQKDSKFVFTLAIMIQDASIYMPNTTVI